MKSLTPTIILQFQGKSSVKETYKIVLKNVVEIVGTIIEEHEIKEAKLLLKDAIAVLETKEAHIWAKRHDFELHKQDTF